MFIYLYVMKYGIAVSPIFEKQAERLNRKYPSIFADIKKLGDDLKTNPFQGRALGKDLYKVRMKIASKGQGKSGGARVITCVKVVENKIILLAIYDKSEQETMTIKELSELLKIK